MTKTIVALYDHRSDAETASRDLQAAGFESSAIEILSHSDLSSGGWGDRDLSGSPTGTLTGDSSIGAASGMARTDLSTGYVASPNTVPGTGAGLGMESGLGAAGTGMGTMGSDGIATGTASGGMLTRLTGWGVPNQDAQVYAEGVRRGGSLLKLRLDEEDVDRAMDVLERGNVVDVEERSSAYREAGWTGYDETAEYYDEPSAQEERVRYSPGRTAIDTTSSTTAGTAAGLTGAAAAMRDVNTDATRTGTSEREEQIPIVEEQVNIGKRSVERGGVRVRSYVVETPVEEQVRLRDETVTVERRPGGMVGGSSEVPADAFRERTIEVTETDEEAVVSKTAHVRETVVVRKDVEERAQSVRDTVRRTEVEIEDTRDKNARNPLSDRPPSDRTDDDVTR
ncbi:YsnF/AvaK domain-containing protein [Azospirillum sp. TSA6c]|uniref:YsnF/AvaK domain-containing protein n=1 Tax=unclassified Azospirillum TaxID=2630922 RepID=UPI000D659756|nr:YsnF/AvaK domain-containing protein [Azospirillum sp. TSA6c]